VWVDRQGHEEAVSGAPSRTYEHPRLSPDGARVALDIRDQENDIWVWDFERQTLTRVSTDPSVDQTPEWMPDSRRVVFSSQPGGIFSIARQSADGTGKIESLATTNNPVRLSGVSSDGTHILFAEARSSTSMDLMVLNLDPLEKRHSVTPLVSTPFTERNGEISPDGRWLAYESNDSNQFQVYVRPFPNIDKARIQISTDSGSQPHWSRDGKELFYIADDGALMSVQVGEGSIWKPGTRTPLAAGRYYRGIGSAAGRAYDVSADGKRFLMIKETDPGASASPRIVVVLNWLEELKRLLPSTR
jgi:serine/threonine-protein kinase